MQGPNAFWTAIQRPVKCITSTGWLSIGRRRRKAAGLAKKKHRPTFRKKTSAKLCACCCCTLLYWTDGCAGRMAGRRLPLCLLQQMTPLHVAACTAARAAHAAATASLCFLAASSTSPPPPRRSCGPSTTGRLSPWALGHNRNIEADMSSLKMMHLWFYHFMLSLALLINSSKNSYLFSKANDI